MTLFTVERHQFFVLGVALKDAVLRVKIGNESVAVVVVFEFVRAALVYKESDYWSKMHDLEKETLLTVPGEASLGVFRIVKNSLVPHPDKLSFDPEIQNYRVSTPDECVDVAAGSPPQFIVRE